MQRRTTLQATLATLTSAWLSTLPHSALSQDSLTSPSRTSRPSARNQRKGSKPMSSTALPFAHEHHLDFTPLTKSKTEWAKILPQDAYHVLFEHGTERAGTSSLNHEKRRGTFICVACNLDLFDSATKYESGTGWPSFWQPLTGRLGTSRDFKLIYPRTEYHCARCGGHQGHVFKDGPAPTGLRYCNNGVALRFIEAGQALPALRT